MMKLGVGALYKNLGRVRILVSYPPGCALSKCGIGLRRWENQRRLSSLVDYFQLDLVFIMKVDIIKTLPTAVSLFVHIAVHLQL